MILALIDEAVASRAAQAKACKLLGLAERTVERWRADEGGEDRRAGPLTTPSHALTEEERKQMVALATSPEYRDISVRQLVPRLADAGVYVASESSFYRVLRQEGLDAHREPSRPRTHSRPKPHVAAKPNEVWSWDITYLRGSVRGTFFYLYLVLDVYSRKIIVAEVNAEESMDLSAQLIEWACEREGVDANTLVLHSDNGGPMKGATMLATLQRLGIAASFSRPQVSDDNPFVEALFRTLKFKPGYPRKGFESLQAARAWVADFVAWYNDVHLHSGLRYVTPTARHEGRDKAILAGRHRLYIKARAKTPRRWSRNTRNWTPVGTVYLNPGRRTDGDDACMMH